MTTSDLFVEPVSRALADKTIEVIVTGSIGAVESVRLVRALRRLGATVRVTLSKGGSKFISPLALEWASANPVQTDFSGTASHVVSGDACVVAPASANFIYKLAAGITDTPSSALATSYCGARKPVLILPNMHSSLSDAPAVKENLLKVSSWGIVAPSRNEEGKRKFPEPSSLADFVAHHVNLRKKHTLVAFGGTKAFLDDVRYFGNYSTGALGTLITEELYRHGIQVTAIVGSAEVLPSSYTSLIRVETNQELDLACTSVIKDCDALVFAPAVLDYIPEQKVVGKLRSGHERLSVTLVSSKKIIAGLHPKGRIKVGFKLESEKFDEQTLNTLANDYITRYQLSMLVVNQLADVSKSKHKATLFESNQLDHPEFVEGKVGLATRIVEHIIQGLQ